MSEARSSVGRAHAARTLDAIAALHPVDETTLGVISRDGDPFRVLVSTVLSQRTRDAATLEASRQLFAVADTPAALARLGEKRVEALIRPVGFYRAKAGTLRALARALLDQHAGEVPRDREALEALPGVGPKTAACVINFGFDEAAVAVDVHVHRISNRLGWVRTDTPEESERALERLFPRNRWIELNRYLVPHGQTVCRPVGPRCDECPIERRCRKRGVQ